MNYIIGMGNVMRSDDGIGSHIIDYILNNKLEKGFYSLDFASNAWGILPLLNSDTNSILIIDCSLMEQEPGTTQFFSLASVMNENKASVESHESSIAQIIKMAKQSGYSIPDISIMGIEPYSIDFGQILSPMIKNKLPDYAREAIQFIWNAVPR